LTYAKSILRDMNVSGEARKDENNDRVRVFEVTKINP
jgi:hypothetical protein